MSLENMINDPSQMGGKIKKAILIPMIAIILISFGMPYLTRALGGLGILIGVLLIVGIIGYTLFTTFKNFGVFDMLKGKMPSLTKQKEIPNGKPAIATVISSRQGSMNVSMGTHKYFQLLIEVTIRDENDSWSATIKQMTPLTQVGMFQPGMTFKVIYNPLDKSEVVIDQNNTQKSGNDAVNMGTAESYTHQDVQNAQQAVPPEIMQRVQMGSALLHELKIVGTASSAIIKSNEVAFKDFMPGVNIVKVIIEVSGTIIDTFDSEQFMISPKTSLHKLETGKTVYIRYDAKNPRRVAISGLDNPDSAQDI